MTTFHLSEVVKNWAIYTGQGRLHFPVLIVANVKNKTQWILEPSSLGDYPLGSETTLPKYVKEHIRDHYEGIPSATPTPLGVSL